MFRTRFWRAEPSRAGCFCTRFFYVNRGVAIVGQSTFRIATFRWPIFEIDIADFERGSVIVCCGCLVRFHAGNEYADFAGSFGIACEPGADSRGGA
ncbi:MAG: hypothetical protein WA867_16590 [Candidatus Acidiferrales bacterium]